MTPPTAEWSSCLTLRSVFNIKKELKREKRLLGHKCQTGKKIRIIYRTHAEYTPLMVPSTPQFNDLILSHSYIDLVSSENPHSVVAIASDDHLDLV